MALILDTSVTPAGGQAVPAYRPILIRVRATNPTTKFVRVKLAISQINAFVPTVELDAELVIDTTDQYEIDVSI